MMTLAFLAGVGALASAEIAVLYAIARLCRGQ